MIEAASDSSHGEKFVDVVGHRVGASLGTVVSNNVTVLVYEKLREVPWDFGATEVRLFSKVLPRSVGIIIVYIYLIHDLELHTVSFLEIFDFFVGSGLLPTKLIAWICDDFHSLFFVLLSQLNEALVVRISQSSLGSNVDDEANFGFVSA